MFWTSLLSLKLTGNAWWEEGQVARANWCPALKKLIISLEGQGGAQRKGRAVHVQLQMKGMGSTQKGVSSMGESSQGKLPGRGGTYLGRKERVEFAWSIPGMS